MLVEKLNEKMESWNNGIVSKEAEHLKEKAESKESVESVYNLIVRNLVEKLDLVKESSSFQSEYKLTLKLPEGKFSNTDVEFFKSQGIKQAWIASVYSLPLLMEMLKNDKTKLESSNQGTMGLDIENDILTIKVNMNSKEFKEKQTENVSEIGEFAEQPVVRKKTFFDLFRRDKKIH